MGKSRHKDFWDEPRVKEVRKGVDKSSKHRKNMYKYSSGYEDEDDYDDDTYRQY